jgi:hypothetical protein
MGRLFTLLLFDQIIQAKDEDIHGLQKVIENKNAKIEGLEFLIFCGA